MRRSTRPWRATSAAAAPTSAFAPPSRRPPEEPEMTAILDNISRRAFLVGGAVPVGGLVVGLRVLPRTLAAGTLPPLGDGTPKFNPTAFVSIDPTGRVTIAAHRPRMGQGRRPALPLAP